MSSPNHSRVDSHTGVRALEQWLRNCCVPLRIFKLQQGPQAQRTPVNSHHLPNIHIQGTRKANLLVTWISQRVKHHCQLLDYSFNIVK